jgi:hypothetical protein
MKNINVSFLFFYLGVDEFTSNLEVKEAVKLLASLLNKEQNINEIVENINEYHIQRKIEGYNE